MTTETLYSAAAVAELLGIDHSRVRRLALARNVGQPPCRAHALWLFTAADIDALRDRRPGNPNRIRPRKPRDASELHG